MTAARVVVTRAVNEWAEQEPCRAASLATYVRRRAAGDWGDVDRDDWAANDATVHHGCGRLLSSYRLPLELVDVAGDDRLWVITDDVEDPDTATTILWPSDYVRHEAL